MADPRRGYIKKWLLWLWVLEEISRSNCYVSVADVGGGGRGVCGTAGGAGQLVLHAHLTPPLPAPHSQVIRPAVPHAGQCTAAPGGMCAH